MFTRLPSKILKVAAMQAQLEDANGREQVMLELCEELSRARSRGHELSAMLSEQVVMK